MARRITPRSLSAEDALAQPTRRRLYALLGESEQPASTAELADRLKLHPNGIRAHLECLAAAGLVTRSRVRRGRGRPADSWTPVPGGAAGSGGAPGHGYRDLGRWLARVLGSAPGSLAAIEQTGRDIGRELADDGTVPTAGLTGLNDALSVLGFRPELVAQGSGAATICLGNCPYRDAVRENQPAVCALHKGITVGLLDRLDPQAEMTAFVPRDPDSAGCTIELERVPN